MFTGIIEEIGNISNMKQTGKAIVMTIAAKKVLSDVNLGDSIAVNGVCLTVTSYTTNQFTVDIMPETVKSTSLQQLSKGSNVNLERAMSAGGRFGGHFVSGHVDGLGTIVKKERVENAVYYNITVPNDIKHYLLYKGSVSVDGTSLTIFGVEDNEFTISLIPHTLSETILGEKGPGDYVNIECDMIGKYIERFINNRLQSANGKSASITESFLEDNGFK
ncbi:riboflavin synthase [Lottiidibacillus patelloidae]|uniref:Riboflavin synthase n=1 Tax=Lottiidibacillus patelloidae TaxID=2670334 RepID=A0A263BTT5_9BACI|nr:riboflavin synthase [Lottiidibacillus patelloidae]OZM57144.1 riboflavin synthase [Lottiidibacillus patelloidae]